MVSQGFDRAIRELQAKLLLALERDVSYTEALNVVLYLGFLRADEQGQRLAFWKQDEQEITEGQTDALLDAFDFDKDRIRETLNMIGISGGGGRRRPGLKQGAEGVTKPQARLGANHDRGRPGRPFRASGGAGENRFSGWLV